MRSCAVLGRDAGPLLEERRPLHDQLAQVCPHLFRNRALERLCQNKTVLLIAHRLSEFNYWYDHARYELN